MASSDCPAPALLYCPILVVNIDIRLGLINKAKVIFFWTPPIEIALTDVVKLLGSRENIFT